MLKYKSLYAKILILYIIVFGVFAFPFVKQYIVSQQNYAAARAAVIETINKQHENAQAIIGPTQPALIEGTPVRIIIASAGIDLTVINGNYDNSSWTLTPNDAQFAVMTSKPNNLEGNTLIYGHNTIPVFYNTTYLKPGDEALVITDNNHVFHYQFRSYDIVNPNNTTVLSYKGVPQLTLLTCNGWFSTYRKLMYFTLTGIN